MATIEWRGGAAAVAQVASAEITAYDAATTYTLAVAGYQLDSLAAGSAAAAAAALVALANASELPHFSGITWTNPSGAVITATADNAGAPFTAALSVSGGTGTRTDFADDTACTGPHHVGEVDNYVGGALPSNGDELLIAGGASLLYGLDALTGVALVLTEIRKSFTGLIGLNPLAFATSADGESTDVNYLEYRATHLELDSDVIRIGDHDGGGSPAGSGRVFLSQQSTAASRLVVVDTASSVAGAMPAVDYLANDADADVEVRSAPGGCGIASAPGATATVGDVIVTDRSQASSVTVGGGCTLSAFEQSGGNNRLRAAATVASVVCRAGDLAIDGEGYSITALSVLGGSVVDEHLNAGGAEWGTIQVDGGELDLPRVYDAGSDRSCTSVKLSRGRITADWSAITGTRLVEASAGQAPRYALEATDA